MTARWERWPVCKHRDGRETFASHLGTRSMGVYNAELWAIGLALRESLQKMITVQTPGETAVVIVSDLQAAIRHTEHLEPGPAHHLARWMNQWARTHREAGIETEIHWVPGHTGIPGNQKADLQANLAS